MMPGRLARARAGAVLLLLAGSALPVAAQELPAGVTAGPWRALLDGSAAAWRGYRLDSLPTAWHFDPATGVLALDGRGGDIVSRDEYADFELELEWRIAPGGNSGIFYRATEATALIYENAPEMQVLDDARHPDGRNRLTSAGANYGLDAPVANVVKPAGEWNAARIVAVGPDVELWLNGTRVVKYTLWSADWAAKVKASKFGQWPSYGLAWRGRIGLQDHGDHVEYRRIRIRELAR